MPTPVAEGVPGMAQIMKVDIWHSSYMRRLRPARGPVDVFCGAAHTDLLAAVTGSNPAGRGFMAPDLDYPGVFDSGRLAAEGGSRSGGVMVWLSGPRRGAGRTKPIVLHDPPPGYRPPKRSSWYLLVNDRHAGVIVRVTAAILVLAAAAVAVIIVLMIAGYH